MGRKKKNYLDFIPVCNPDYTWDADKKGIVTVHVVNKGFYNRIAQKLFHRPLVTLRWTNTEVLYGVRWTAGKVFMIFQNR